MTQGPQTESASSRWDDAYRRYQVMLATRFLIPTLARWGVAVAGKRMLEVGCGDGGCAATFARAGCAVTALDIDERLVTIAREINQREGVDARLHVGDIEHADCPGLDEGPFDVVLLRDVVEHLENLVGALRNVRAHLADGGVVMVVFPPYYSPYGAHQQILPRKTLLGIPYNKLPWIHLLPTPWFLRAAGGAAASNREVARLRSVRLTLRRFGRDVATAGLRVRARRHYLFRPSFQLRYGAPVLPAGVLGSVPLLRELVVTAGYYLLEKAPEASRGSDAGTT